MQLTFHSKTTVKVLIRDFGLQSQIVKVKYMNDSKEDHELKTAIEFSYDTVVKQKLLHWTIISEDEINTSENDLCQCLARK